MNIFFSFKCCKLCCFNSKVSNVGRRHLNQKDPAKKITWVHKFTISETITHSLFFPLQLPVCSHIADLLAPSAGDAGDLQFSRPVAVGWPHPWRGDRPLPQPDNCQEKGHRDANCSKKCSGTVHPKTKNTYFSSYL